MELPNGTGASAPALYPVKMKNEFAPRQIEDCLDNIRINVKRNLPQLSQEQPKGGDFVIVGGGPSLKSEIKNLKKYDKPGNRIVCLNDTLGFLLKHGIKPWGMTFMEVAEWHPQAILRPVEGVTYLVASMAHPKTYDALKGRCVLQWHAWLDIGEMPIIQAVYRHALFVGGGSSAGLRSINIGIAMGFHRFHLFGMDSSFEEKTHAFTDRPEDEVPIFAGDRKFKSQSRLVKQVLDFQEFCRLWPAFHIVTHGDGLLQHVHRRDYPSVYQERT